MSNENMTYRCELYAIEGWRTPDGWTANRESFLAMFPATDAELTPRRLLASLRADDYLSEKSKGKIGVNETSMGECDSIEITNRATGEPLFDVRVYCED